MPNETQQTVEKKAEEVKTVPFRAPLAVGGGISAIVPQDFDQVWRMAQVIKAAGMAPKSLDSVEKISIAVMQGLEVGLKPMQAIQSIAVINNMPTIYGDAMLALVISSPVYGDHEEWQELDDKGEVLVAVCRARRKGSERWFTQEITRQFAAKAGWLQKQGPWTQATRRMYQMRARGWCLRDTFPDVLRGLISAEEAEDIIDITPRGSATTAPPEPRRSDYVYAGNGSAAAKQEDPPHDAQTGEVEEDPWLAIGDTPMQIAESMAALVEKVRSLDDIAKFEAANKEHLVAATEQVRRRVMRDLNEVRKSLGGGG